MEIGKKAVRDFGKKVRLFRLKKRWSQDDLASELEVDRSYISGLERGVRNPTLKTIARLAHMLDVTISQLCEGI